MRWGEGRGGNKRFHGGESSELKELNLIQKKKEFCSCAGAGVPYTRDCRPESQEWSGGVPNQGELRVTPTLKGARERGRERGQTVSSAPDRYQADGLVVNEKSNSHFDARR